MSIIIEIVAVTAAVLIQIAVSGACWWRPGRAANMGPSAWWRPGSFATLRSIVAKDISLASLTSLLHSLHLRLVLG